MKYINSLNKRLALAVLVAILVLSGGLNNKAMADGSTKVYKKICVQQDKSYIDEEDYSIANIKFLTGYNCLVRTIGINKSTTTTGFLMYSLKAGLIYTA